MSTLRTMGRGVVLGMGALALETAYAVLRPVPDQPEFDPSGRTGDGRRPTMRWVVLGDSTITAPGVEHVDEIWIRRLARSFSDRWTIEIESFAEGGAMAGMVRYEQLPRATQRPCDIAFVSVGGNDALRGVPSRVFEDHLGAVVAALDRVARGIMLLGVGDLGTIPRLLPPLDLVMARRGIAIDAVHARVAAGFGAAKPDMWEATTVAFREPGIFSADLFHPNGEGHRVWAEAIEPSLQTLVDVRGIG